jgi:DNA invertase Pin-like site-specific DNA recombinase
MRQESVRAAQYLRMSSEGQRYSLPNQIACNAAYAEAHGFEIVRTYADPGISGLRLTRRKGLQQLLADVLGGSPGYSAVLVYDVSRWGRFQDLDESAHYEFLCRSAGAPIHYTAEPFDANDPSWVAAMIKHVKRGIAAEFSRDLSRRVSRFQRTLSLHGYWMGGPTPYGYLRRLVGPAGEDRGLLARGQRGALRGDRVVLTPGPREQVRTVRRIFRAFAGGQEARQIANRLNEEAVPTDAGSPWTGDRIRALLRNEVYIGANVHGKVQCFLGERRRVRPADWARTPNAFEPLVSERLFKAVQRRFRTYKAVISDDLLLDELRDALERHGKLSAGILDHDPNTHCASVFSNRFGRLSAAYALVGYQMTKQQTATSAASLALPPERRRQKKKVSDEVVLERLAKILADQGRLTKSLNDDTLDGPRSFALSRRFGGLKGLYDRLDYEPNEKQLNGMKGRAGKLKAAQEATAWRADAS